MNTLNIYSDSGILASDHYLTMLFNNVIKFLNAEKSVGGHVKNL